MNLNQYAIVDLNNQGTTLPITYSLKDMVSTIREYHSHHHVPAEEGNYSVEHIFEDANNILKSHVRTFSYKWADRICGFEPEYIEEIVDEDSETESDSDIPQPSQSVFDWYGGVYRDVEPESESETENENLDSELETEENPHIIIVWSGGMDTGYISESRAFVDHESAMSWFVFQSSIGANPTIEVHWKYLEDGELDNIYEFYIKEVM